MSYISDSIRLFVRRRAGNRCEYCLSHQNYVMGRLQVDHVVPLAKGGADHEDNLCLACEFCNQHKWAKTQAIDPQSGRRIHLFNPRLDRWEEHFAWSDDGTKIIGLTACGRTTVVALQLNNILAVTVRKNWVIAGWHPPKDEA